MMPDKTSEILQKDTDLRFPHFMILRASAGSGKTHALTRRFVQFILSGKIHGNDLKNILAITFSNNAAKEMKERILDWLKALYFGEREKLDQIKGIITITPAGGKTTPEETRLMEKAGEAIERILDNYSDFRIRTIDSFMATIFKASSVDLGYTQDFEIVMNTRSIFEYAFELFLRGVREGERKEALLSEAVYKIMESRPGTSAYPWDPSGIILSEIRKLHLKVSSLGKELKTPETPSGLEEIKEEMAAVAEKLGAMIDESGLEKNSRCTFPRILSLLREGSFPDLVKVPTGTPPLKKVPPSDRRADAYEAVLCEWERFRELLGRFTLLYSALYYQPYLMVYRDFQRTLDEQKRALGRVFIEDVNHSLSEYLDGSIVPDVYFRLGETVFHYLIDEFQDTSPIQWKNLFPLIEDSLSVGGSLFVVGDTKQAIYGFREADYTIMRALEGVNPFPSALHTVEELHFNHRSKKEILRFNERVFKDIAGGSRYAEAAAHSGLSDYTQKPTDADRGYTEIVSIDRNDAERPEKGMLLELVGELRERGYNLPDIAILAFKNYDVVRITSWLNEGGVPFISHSSLDIRQRKLTGEIISFLNFIDSPVDDLSFIQFILGDIFQKRCSHHGLTAKQIHDFIFKNREEPHIYRAFQREFPGIWDSLFKKLFRLAGHLPLYDLVTEAFRTFNLFGDFIEEEATLSRTLEAIKEFEERGSNSLKDFIAYSRESGDDTLWNMDVPKGIDAVNVMTIHKAKGLGFPVVIVLLYGDTVNRGIPYIIGDEPEGVTLLRINGEMAKKNALLEQLYREAVIRNEVNSLNSLYVGFTRAVSEMYVLAVRKERERYPFELLPFDDFPSSERPERAYSGAKESPPETGLYHHDRGVEISVNPDAESIFWRKRGESSTMPCFTILNLLMVKLTES